MNCLADERFVELLDLGGLDATRPDERAHLEACETCRESWATVAAAGEILAEARPRTARGRLVPVMVAAAMLLTIIGLIVWKSSPPVAPPKDPVVVLLEGTPEEVRQAREALLKQGKKAIPMLVAARPKFKGSARLQALQDLIFDLKRAALKQDREGAEAFAKLEKLRVDLALLNTNAEQIASFIRDFSKVNVYVDPTLPPGQINEFTMQNATLRSVLEILCAVADLDFDFRYGVVFLTTPMRMWSQDPAVGLPTANAWKKQALAGADVAAGDKLRSIRITIDMQNGPLNAVAGYIAEISKLEVKVDPTIADEPVTFKVQDISLDGALELMTLVRGWDIRMEGGEFRIVPRGK